MEKKKEKDMQICQLQKAKKPGDHGKKNLDIYRRLQIHQNKAFVSVYQRRKILCDPSKREINVSNSSCLFFFLSLNQNDSDSLGPI